MCVNVSVSALVPCVATCSYTAQALPADVVSEFRW